ncbi:conserved oligomeric Golgi complex subunit 2-like [Mercenaria mercenaria]|uniref:conserved oligomeric Golgi complex subunit 2-like n=1 Tax=Mercenaria mercenaria TaxID=6596 RepID=UPI00234F4EC8|nr:conserved oligomeric Golgi complex subunit 2-like [Mercenaria mercenaria]
MTGDPVKSVPLPNGPASLCFDKDEFMKDDFNVDHFVLECRRRVQLEDFRDDLSIYLKILRSAMIELINKDYADFVNLSSNLVGMDKAIGSLTAPLEQLRDEVLNVRKSMDEAILAVEDKLRKRQQIKQGKACIQRLINITESVDKIERLLGIHSADGGEGPSHAGPLNGQLIERVATEFNKLQFYVTKSRGLPLVEQIKPRIANITTTLQFSLEGSFLEGLDAGNVDILRQCLRTYSLIDKIRDAESLYRQHIVKPYMEEVISEQFIKSNHNGLKGMFDKVLQFIPQHCKLLTDVTSRVTAGSSDAVRGYDFIVNSVWPEVVSNIEAKTSSIFAPGNPNIFHAKYLISMEFLERFEALCGSQASVKRLRDHQSYHTFINKWSLPVYFQIRFQEIAGGFESSLFTAFNKSPAGSEFHLHSTHELWKSLQTCWQDEIYLLPLSHRFWKLNIQILARYSTWLDEAYKEQITDRSDNVPEVKTKSGPERAANGPDTLPPGGQTEGRITPTVPQAPPITIGQIISLISDAGKLLEMLPGFLDKTVIPRLSGLDEDTINSLKVCLNECSSAIQSCLPQFRDYVVVDVTNQCAVHLKQVNDIPRLYRRTNREVPSKPSQYITAAVKPLTVFIEEHSDVLGDQQKIDICAQVFSNLAEQYFTVTSDVLSSVKKMEESLKRLKKGRGQEKTAGSHGITDDDKIRQQLILDITNYGTQVSKFGVETSQVNYYSKLLELSEEAKSSMTSVNTSSS